MRTTVNLDQDVAAAVARLREDLGMGLSEALNALARSGSGLLFDSAPAVAYEQTTHELGLRLDVTNVAEALDALEASS